jgi:hypothetical protein
MNRLAMSCAWPNGLTTPSLASLLMRQMPGLCVLGYGGVRYVLMAPAAW